jgi:hypothetical protein
MLNRISAGASKETVTSAAVPGPKAAEPVARVGGKSFAEVLAGLSREIDKGERMMSQVTRGGHGRLDAGDLLKLQVGVYRYSEAIDLAAKLVDRAGAAVRTTIQGGGGG